MTGPSNKN